MSLRSLSNQKILSQTRELVHRERTLTLEVLLHLNEIERRRLYLGLGHPSMFEYCIATLGYSSSAAGRRIRTARCVVRFPAVYALLESNDINLSTVCQVAGILTAENADAVLASIRGKSQREVDAIVAGYQPTSALPRDSVRAVVVETRHDAPIEKRADSVALPRVSARPGDTPSRTPLDAPDGASIEDASMHSRSGSASVVTHSTETHYVVQFAAASEFMTQLERARSLAGHRLPPNATFEQVFAFALAYFIKNEDPIEREARREKRVARSETRASAELAHGADNSRYVPARIRDKVFARDKGRCTFVGSAGKRCNASRGIQIDHVKPIAHGGASTVENLRLLCAQHNRLEAERILGTPLDHHERRNLRAP